MYIFAELKTKKRGWVMITLDKLHSLSGSVTLVLLVGSII